ALLTGRTVRHGGVAGHDARRHPPGLCPRRVGATRAEATAAIAAPPAPPGPPEENPLERADHGALSARGRRRDVSGPLSARWPDQERALGGLGRCMRYLCASCTP